jgi:hypothetical protein
MLTFSTLEEAASAIRDVSADYDRHARAARACAAEHFEAGKVLAKVLEQAGL